MTWQKLRPDQAESLQAAIDSDAWQLLESIIEDRILDQIRRLRSGKLDHDEYVAVCESIRTAEYLRDRPKQLIQQARMGI